MRNTLQLFYWLVFAFLGTKIEQFLFGAIDFQK